MAQYIDKNTLMVEIEKRKEAFETSDGRRFHSLSDQILWNAFNSIQDIINSLEVKEVQKEPVSEDLEEAVNTYIGYAPEVDESSSTYGKRQAFKAGANWQKEQMMAKAVDGFVIEDIEEGNGDFLLSAEYLSKDMGLKDRQKVKVIVIRED